HLLDQRGDTLDQGDSRSNQGRQLPGQQCQLLRRNALDEAAQVETAGLGDGGLYLLALFLNEVGREYAVAPQLDAGCLRCVGIEDAAHRASLWAQTFVGVNRHCPSPSDDRVTRKFDPGAASDEVLLRDP